MTVSGVIRAVGSACCFGSGAPATKALATTGLSSLEIAQARMSVAMVLLLAFALVTVPRQLVVRSGEWPLVAAFGILAFCVNQTFYTVAVGRLPVGIALVLLYLAPVMIVAWVRFVRRVALARRAWLGVGAVFAGLMLVVEVWSGFRLDVTGVLAGVGAAGALTARFLLSERGLRSRSPVALAALGTAVGAITLDILSPVTSFPFALAWHGHAEIGGFQVPTWVLLGWIAVVCTVLAYLAGVSAQQYLAPAVVSQFATLEVVVAAALAALLLGERLSLPQVAGTALILVGLLAAQTGMARTRLADVSAVDRSGDQPRRAVGPPYQRHQAGQDPYADREPQGDQPASEQEYQQRAG